MIKELFQNFIEIFFNCLPVCCCFFKDINLLYDMNGVAERLFLFKVNQAFQINKKFICTHTLNFHSEQQRVKTYFFTHLCKSKNLFKKIFDFFLRNIFQSILPVHLINQNSVKRVIWFLKISLNLIFLSFYLTHIILYESRNIFCDRNQWWVKILFIFWWLFFCLFTCLGNGFENLFRCL